MRTARPAFVLLNLPVLFTDPIVRAEPYETAYYTRRSIRVWP